MIIAQDDVVLMLWTASIPPAPGHRQGDWQCFVKVSATGQLEAEYRFRWHAGPGFDTDDEKSFFQLGPVQDSPEEREALFRAIRKVCNTTPGFENVHEREVNGDGGKLFEVLMSIPEMNLQLTKEPKP